MINIRPENECSAIQQFYHQNFALRKYFIINYNLRYLHFFIALFLRFVFVLVVFYAKIIILMMCSNEYLLALIVTITEHTHALNKIIYEMYMQSTQI